MAERLGVLGATTAPIREQSQGAGEVAAIGGQGVLHPWRPLLVRPGMDDALAVEPP